MISERRVVETPAKKQYILEQVSSVPTAGTTPEQELESITNAIQKEHEAVLASFRTGLTHAREIGELLKKAKSLVRHGHWTNWVEQNCRFGEKTAENYMRIAKHWGEIESKAVSVADLRINQALALIKKPKVKPVIEKHGGFEPEGDTKARVGGEIEPDDTDDKVAAIPEPIVEPQTKYPWEKDFHTDDEDELDEQIAKLDTVLKRIVPDFVQPWDLERRSASAKRLTHLRSRIDKALAALCPTVNADDVQH